MSRLIVKNIPKNISESRLRDIFGKHGDITQVKIKVKRRFAYIGYMTNKEAKAALKYHNGTYIDTSKIEVAEALAYGDSQLPRAWSKYTESTSANKDLFEKRNARILQYHKEQGKSDKQKGPSKEDQIKAESARVQKEKEMLSQIYELKEGQSSDIDKQEFWNVMGPNTNRRSWANDGGAGSAKQGSTKVTAKYASVEGKMYGAKGQQMTRSHLTFADSDDEYQELGSEKDQKGSAGIPEEEDVRNDEAVDETISDLAYLRSKMTENVESLSETEDMQLDENKEESKPENVLSKAKKKKKKKKTIKEQQECQKNTELASDTNTVRVRGLPFTATEKDIREFFHPLVPIEVRMPRDRFDRPSGRAYIDFNEVDVKRALQYNKDYMGDRFLEVTMDDEGRPELKPAIEKEPRKFPVVDIDFAALAESGRLFVRNLSYLCKEDDLKDLFSQFGPLSEVQIPIDRESKKSKAIAFITFLMPEHAVTAFQALDGKPFQGRLLHLLPAKERRDTGVAEDNDAGNNYKKKQAAKRKAEDSAFNWNTLFMRSDTVADAMAESYGVEKRDILDKDADSSIAVRMALGETHIVAENKKFLQENGVRLDAFDTKVHERSKSLILVKNTPHDTTDQELRTLFAKHGDVRRVIVPPSKTMAIIEMAVDQEARTAFRALAYRKFKHVPLYLEWAPAGCLEPIQGNSDNADIYKDEDEDEDEEDVDAQTATLFVKNLNFNTTDEGLTAFFERCTGIRSARVVKTNDMKNPGKKRSMGFGFVEFPSSENAMKALKTLQHGELDGHKLELKVSKSATAKAERESRGHAVKVGGTKLLLRNLAFETNKKELKELCGTFGQIKSVRLPKKFDGAHRGFAFVDFLTKKEAKNAFEALSVSTHLYGRRVVVEWAEDDNSLEGLQQKTKTAFQAKGNVRASKRAKLDETLISK